MEDECLLLKGMQKILMIPLQCLDFRSFFDSQFLPVGSENNVPVISSCSTAIFYTGHVERLWMHGLCPRKQNLSALLLSVVSYAKINIWFYHSDA